MFLVNKKIFEATKEKFFYGWVIVGIGSLGIFTSGAGQSHTFSPFIPVISQDPKISSTSITTAYMIATLFAAFLLIVIIYPLLKSMKSLEKTQLSGRN